MLGHGDKAGWVEVGSACESDFLPQHGAKYGLRLNPEKADNCYAPDFVYRTRRYADLKTVTTPFRIFPGCVTLNAKDVLRYRRCYGDLDLIFWIRWAEPTRGVWRASLRALIDARETFALHFYNRTPAERPIETDPVECAWLEKMEPQRLHAFEDNYYRVMDNTGNATCSYVIPVGAPLDYLGEA